MKALKESITGLRIVFGNFKYLIIAIVTALLFYSFNVFVSNWKVIFSVFSSGIFEGITFIFKLMFGFMHVIPLSSFYSLVITSLLFGVLLSIIIFRISLNIKANKSITFLGASGILLGALIPGCFACGIGLVSALGLSGAIVQFFPYKGLEIALISIVLLGFSIMLISRDLVNCKECQILINKEMKGGKSKWLKKIKNLQ